MGRRRDAAVWCEAVQLGNLDQAEWRFCLGDCEGWMFVAALVVLVQSSSASRRSSALALGVSGAGPVDFWVEQQVWVVAGPGFGFGIAGVELGHRAFDC